MLLLSLLLLLSSSLSLAQNSDSSGSAMISGVVFLDSNADGTHDTTDNDNEKGVGGISIWLFSCDTIDTYFDSVGSSSSNNNIPTLFPLLKTTETNALGQYTFNTDQAAGLLANNVNQYYINVQTRGWYTVSPTWDETAMTVVVVDGSSIIGGMSGVNAVDPTTGDTPCFVLQPNENRIVDIGLVFDVPSDLVIGTNMSPTATPTTVVVVDDVIVDDVEEEDETSSQPPTSSPVIKISTTSSPSSTPEEDTTTTIVVPNPSNNDNDDNNNEEQQTIEQPSPTPPTTTTTKPTASTPTIIVVPSNPSNTNNNNNNSNNNDEGGLTGDEEIIDDDNGVDATTTTTTTQSPSPSTTTSTTSPTTKYVTTVTTPTNNDDSTEIATQSPTPSGQDEVKDDESEEEKENILVDDDALSEPYTMTLRGITNIEDIDAWVDTTTLHIEDYFNNNNENENVSNVTVEIIIYDKDKQQQYSQQRRWVMMRRWLQNDEDDVAVAVEVMYQQKTTYQTSNRELYNEKYIATEPFIKDENSYIESLQQLSPYYNDVTSLEVSSEDTLPIDPTLAKEEADNNNIDGNSMSNTMLGLIFGSISGGILVVAGLSLFIYKLRSKTKNKDKEYMTSVGNGPASSMRQFHNNHSSNCLADDLESARDDDTEDTIRCGNGGGDTRAGSQSPPTTSNVMLNIIIPPGIAGIVLDTRPGVRGCAYVCKIKNNCPIKDQIQLEDRIIAVDDEDVQTMNAIKLSKLLAKRSANAQRKITILRRVVNTDGYVGDGNLPPILSNDDQLVEDNDGVAEGETIDVIAPSGKLGIILVDPESPDPPGPAFVFNIRDDGPLVDMVKLGDRIIAIDDVDVRTMSAENVSKLLGSKNSEPRRKISILRVSNNESQQTSPVVSPRTKANNNKVVAIRAEIITLCAAMNFPMHQRDDMLEQYVGREEQLLQDLKQRKAIQEKGK